MPLRPAARTAVATALAGGLLLATPASAHVSVTPESVVAGEDTLVTLAVDHGCGTSATTRLEVRLPDQLDSVSSGPSRSWRVEQQDRVLVLTAATPLPSDLAADFTLSFRAPDRAGEVLAFPTVQTCVEGEQAWTQVAADGSAADLEHPAPTVRVVAEEAASAADDPSWVTVPVVLVAGLAGLALLAAVAVTTTRSRRRATRPPSR